MSAVLPSLFLALLLSAGPEADPFAHASYRSADIDELVKESLDIAPQETTGQTALIPPRRVHLMARLESYPKSCPELLPHLLLKTVRIPDPPPMARCMQLRSRSGVIVNAWIQESISGFVGEEYELGEPIEFRALWLFVNASDKKPYFVVNSIGPGPESQDGGLKKSGKKAVDRPGKAFMPASAPRPDATR